MGCRGMGEEVRGLRSTELQNSNGDINHSIGNGVAKELIHITHGHEQGWGDCLREWKGTGWWGPREKNWDNCNSIINKV